MLYYTLDNLTPQNLREVLISVASRRSGKWIMEFVDQYNDMISASNEGKLTQEEREQAVTNIIDGIRTKWEGMREIVLHSQDEKELSFGAFMAVANAFSADLPPYTISGGYSRKKLRLLGPAKINEQGRNDPCNCGSGKKYKKCCANVTANT